MFAVQEGKKAYCTFMQLTEDVEVVVCFGFFVVFCKYSVLVPIFSFWAGTLDQCT